MSVDWSSPWFWKNLLVALALPPTSLLILMFIGITLLPRRRSAGASILLIVLVFLWALSTPYIGHLLLALPGETKPFDPNTLQFYKPEDRPQAIVVLGGGRIKGAREYDPAPSAPEVASNALLPEALGPSSIARVRYTAWLHRLTSLPILASGGMPDGGVQSEATLMKAMLERELATPVRMIEDKSTNTADSARMSATLLQPLGYKRVLLVTDYWHAPRARAAFRDAGFEVIVAPMGFTSFDVSDPREWLPSSRGLSMSRMAIREVGGYAVNRAMTKMGITP